MIHKIFTKDGFISKAGADLGRVLNLGCGQTQISGAVNLDVNPRSRAEVIHDLNAFPYPFADNAFDVIVSRSILEHLSDIPAVMDELYRILKPGGRVIIQVPYFRSQDAFNDPTHKAFFAAHSLDYFVYDKKLFEYKYAKHAKFKLIGLWFGWPSASKNPARRLLKAFINARPDFYEKYLSLIFPVKIINYELEKLQ